MGRRWIQGMICTCLSHNTACLEQMSSFFSLFYGLFFFFFFFYTQYIFTCLHGGLTPHLTVVHHSAIIKYQEEQGGLNNQVSRSRAQSKPPPLPLKRVRWHFYTGTRSVINRGTTCQVSSCSLVLQTSTSVNSVCSATCLKSFTHGKFLDICDPFMEVL